MTDAAPPGGGRARHVALFAAPRLWPLWPFLPVVRRAVRGDVECGLLFDGAGAYGVYGHSATVFLTDLLSLPRTLGAFLALPREAYDTPDEVYDAGWRAD